MQRKLANISNGLRGGVSASPVSAFSDRYFFRILAGAYQATTTDTNRYGEPAIVGRLQMLEQSSGFITHPRILNQARCI